MRSKIATASVVCAAVLALVGCESTQPHGTGSPLIPSDGDALVGCSGHAAFPASVMDGGVSGSGIDSEVAAALDRLDAWAGIDSPLRGVPAAEA